MRTFRFHDTALLEYQEITRYYLERSRKAAEHFIADVEEAIEKIVAFPEAFKPIGADVRCFILHRYPYGIYYSLEEDDSVFILEVVHMARKARHWQDRRG